MNIYHVGPIPHQYDEYSDFVIIAEDEATARLLAHSHALYGENEEYRCWKEEMINEWGESGNTPLFLTAPVTLLGPSAEEKPRVVLGSFHAG
jgi:hypothetical protein